MILNNIDVLIKKDVSIILKFISIIFLFSTYIIPTVLNLPWIVSILIAGIDSAALIVLLTSSCSRLKVQNEMITGYWKYSSISKNLDDDSVQNVSAPRIVKIEEINGKLNFMDLNAIKKTYLF